QRLAAGVEDGVVAGLPTLELGTLAGALAAGGLEELAGDLPLLTLVVPPLALGLPRPGLNVGRPGGQGDGCSGVGDGRRGVLPGGRDLHAIGPSCRSRRWVFA